MRPSWLGLTVWHVEWNTTLYQRCLCLASLDRINRRIADSISDLDLGHEGRQSDLQVAQRLHKLVLDHDSWSTLDWDLKWALRHNCRQHKQTLQPASQQDNRVMTANWRQQVDDSLLVLTVTAEALQTEFQKRAWPTLCKILFQQIDDSLIISLRRKLWNSPCFTHSTGDWWVLLRLRCHGTEGY